ncbi:hypothetical protein VTJ49DRAFT_1957 [Mycothermus thermophilus]|uniref:NECAP PHear domain-containing protein n=1 Tax=Humicola insolens TaxID=85995 RepID=A0ABR3VPK1_HUMIN
MENAILDPETGHPLPEDAIIRVLHITSRVHVYTLPPNTISTTRGYQAATWTADPRNPIFTGRLRVLETSFSLPSSSKSTPPSPPPAPAPAQQSQQQQQQQQPTQETNDAPQQHLKVTILLEDPSSGALFAACPYDHPRAVQPTADSSRFFALRVRDPSGKQRATLGVGFEDRAEAFDFGVALQEAGRGLAAMGVEGFSSSSSSSSSFSAAAGGAGEGVVGSGSGTTGAGKEGGEGGAGGGKDWSLKEGETITVKLSGTRFGRRAASGSSDGTSGGGGKETTGQSLAAFALPPPPPPPSSTRSAREERAQKRLSAQAQQLGFDDGQFGEFA